MESHFADIQADDIKHGLYDDSIVEQMTRDEMEEALVKDDIGFILDNAQDTEFLAITLLEGFKGYRNMALDELVAEYRERKAE